MSEARKTIHSEQRGLAIKSQILLGRSCLKSFRRWMLERLESCRSCQFNSPHGTTGIERTFQFDESRGVASKNPHLRVWRLLPQERRHQSGYPSDFYFHDVAYRFVF